MMDDNTCGTDGALDRVFGHGQKQLKCVPAIFIHAGAGFHSHQNEHVHLQACVAYVCPFERLSFPPFPNLLLCDAYSDSKSCLQGL